MRIGLSGVIEVCESTANYRLHQHNLNTATIRTFELRRTTQSHDFPKRVQTQNVVTRERICLPESLAFWSRSGTARSESVAHSTSTRLSGRHLSLPTGEFATNSEFAHFNTLEGVYDTHLTNAKLLHGLSPLHVVGDLAHVALGAGPRGRGTGAPVLFQEETAWRKVKPATTAGSQQESTAVIHPRERK